MTAKELREAAERVKLVYDDEGLSQGDIDSITDYILANVPEDGSEPVDEDWLREEWGWTEQNGIRIWSPCGTYTILMAESVLYFGFRQSVHVSIVISTRSQFRSLMKGLNIEPKNKSQKTNECYICGNVIEYGECECTDD